MSPGTSKRGAAKGKKKVSASTRAGLILPVGRIGGLLHRGHYAHRTSQKAPVAMAAVLEYLAFEILDLAAAQNCMRKRITPRDILLGIRNDLELDELFTSCKDSTIREGGVVPGLIMPYERPKPKRVVKKKQKKRKKKKSERSDMDTSGRSAQCAPTPPPDC